MPIELGSFSLGSIAGGIVGAIAGHYLTKSRNTEERKAKIFNAAASAFRDAFAPELSAIKNPSFDETVEPVDLGTLLRNAFDKHRTAVTEFRRSLEGSRQREFDRAWHSYYAYDDTGDDVYEHLVKYSPSYTGELRKECREFAIANIEKLLEFAQHK